MPKSTDETMLDICWQEMDNLDEMIKDLYYACTIALESLNTMTSEEFSRGIDKPVREEFERVIDKFKSSIP